MRLIFTWANQCIRTSQIQSKGKNQDIFWITRNCDLVCKAHYLTQSIISQQMKIDIWETFASLSHPTGNSKRSIVQFGPIDRFFPAKISPLSTQQHLAMRRTFFPYIQTSAAWTIRRVIVALEITTCGISIAIVIILGIGKIHEANCGRQDDKHQQLLVSYHGGSWV